MWNHFCGLKSDCKLRTFMHITENWFHIKSSLTSIKVQTTICWNFMNFSVTRILREIKFGILGAVDIQRYSNSMYLFSRFTNYIEAPELPWLKPKLNSHQASWVTRLFAKRPPKRHVKVWGLNSQMPLLMVDPDKAKEEIDSNLSCDTTLLQSPKKCALSQKLCLVEKLSQQNPVLQIFKSFDLL